MACVPVLRVDTLNRVITNNLAHALHQPEQKELSHIQ